MEESFDESLDKFILEINTLIEKLKKFLELAGCTVDITDTDTGDAKDCFTYKLVRATSTTEPYFTINPEQIITYDTILLLMGDYERIINQGNAINDKLGKIITERPSLTIPGGGGLKRPIEDNEIRDNINDKSIKTTSIELLEKEIGKNTTFLLISGWYPATPKYNLWVQYTNVLPTVQGMTSAVINDKNVFLYNLVTLDDEFKNKICQKYIGIYDVLSPGNPADMRAQAYESIMTFCFEVFINLGFRDTDEDKNRDLKTRIDKFIREKGSFLKDKINEMNALSAKEDIVSVSGAEIPETGDGETQLGPMTADIIVIPGATQAQAASSVATHVQVLPPEKKYDPVKSSDIVPEILNGIEKKTEYATRITSLSDFVNKHPGVEITKDIIDSSKPTGTMLANIEIEKLTTPKAAAGSEEDIITIMDTGVDIAMKATNATISFNTAKKAAQENGIDINSMISSDPDVTDFLTGGGKNMVGGRKNSTYNINIDGFYNREPPTIIELVKIFTYTGLTTLLILGDDASNLYELIQIVISVKLLKEDFAKITVPDDETIEREEYNEAKKEYDDIFKKYIKKIQDIVPDKKLQAKVYSFLDMWECPECTYINKNTSVDCFSCDERWRCPECTYINEKTSDVCEVCDTPKPHQGGGSNRIQKGGTNIEEMKQKIESQSILMNEIFGSHPYKPIYFTLYSYCRELDVTDIEQSWDYEQFIQFFVIMNEMVEKMAVNLNTPDKNENMNAVVSGYGLRELIFTSHQYIERDDICKTALQITNEDYYNY